MAVHEVIRIDEHHMIGPELSSFRDTYDKLCSLVASV
jgi:hypothetical protein